VTGPNRDLHSGHFGGAVGNPINELCRLIAKVQDEHTGKIQIPGFYDDVVDLTNAEREMIAKVTFEETTYNELPYKYEAGTPDYVGTVGLAAALDYVESIGLEDIAKHEEDLLHYASERLIQEFPKAYILGNSKNKAGVLSFGIGNIHAFDLGTLLDQLGIAIRTGHHCAEPLLNYYGYTSIARASFALYNTREEVDKFIEALHRINAMLEP